jgi:N-acetylmuramoyl-L-alanine amidase
MHRRWFVIAGLVLITCVTLGGGRRGEPRAFVLDNKKVVKMKRVARYYGLDFQRDRIHLADENHQFSFSADSRKVLYNGSLFWLYEPLQRKRGGWILAEVDRSSLMDPLLRPDPYLSSLPEGPVYLDAGHGGDDTGARGPGGTLEKHLAFETCKSVQRLLRAAGIDARLTRTDDRRIDLKQRCRIAKEGRGSLFLSIHFNSASNRKAEGVETYMLPRGGLPSTAGNLGNAALGNQFDGANVLLAQAIHHHTVRSVRAPDRGIKKSRFVVLKYAPCPAALLECGFLSNKAEEKRIKTSTHRDALAEGIARGIQEYLGTCRRARLKKDAADIASAR